MARKTYEDCTDSAYKNMAFNGPGGQIWFTDAKISESDYCAISPIWKALKAAREEKDNYKCVCCSSPYNLECHHKRYPPAWGLEDIDDLITVCNPCHKKKIHMKGQNNNGTDFGFIKKIHPRTN